MTPLASDHSAIQMIAALMDNLGHRRPDAWRTRHAFQGQGSGEKIRSLCRRKMRQAGEAGIMGVSLSTR